MFSRLTWDVLGIVAVATLSSYALTALARVASQRIGLLDRPDSGRKSHAEPIPLLGGVALYGSLLIASGGYPAYCLGAMVLTLLAALVIFVLKQHSSLHPPGNTTPSVTNQQ